MGHARKTLLVGITGGIACGKSETGKILKTMGFEVCDADGVAHELIKKGSDIFHEIVALFGPEILTKNGEIARPVLGKIVFKNPDGLASLNRLVHPAVRIKLNEWINQKRDEGKDAAVLIPLLFEAGMQDLDMDSIWCVSSPPQRVIRRLKQRGLTDSEAKNRMSLQMPLKKKEKKANYVIPNGGTLEELESAIRKTVEAMVS